MKQTMGMAAQIFDDIHAAHILAHAWSGQCFSKQA